MKLVSYKYEDLEQVGIMKEDLQNICPVKAIGFNFDSMQELIENSDQEMLMKMSYKAQGCERTIPYEKTRRLSPIPVMRRDMICIGFNFKSHAEEIAKSRGESTASASVSYPIYFSKRVYNATGDGEPVPFIKDYAQDLDCGVEVAVVIGKDAINVPITKVEEYVFGYTIANDICDTRINKIYTQPFLGKSLDGYMPVGPWIVTKDEFAKNPIFDLKLEVNGSTRQEGTTESLVFSIPYIISELSRNMTLKSGTMISTGSPANIHAGDPEKLKLLPGDIMCCHIAGIGELTNPVVEKSIRGNTR